MFRNSATKYIKDQQGIGLITAIFVIVVVSMFGLLIARFSMLGTTMSVEQYLWTQALYSAQSAAQTSILYGDGGGSGSNSLSSVAGFSVSSASIPGGNGVRSTATRNINGKPISRTIEIHITP